MGPISPYLARFQRVLAAFLAISLRRLALMPSARALPPMRPSATAAAFLPSSVVRSSISPVAILPIMTAAPITSAGRFSPLGPRGMSLSPDNSFRFFEDFYAVPSTASETNDGCLLYFVPKNAGRIFDVHKNSLLAHIGAFDPVHLRLLF